MIINSKGCYNSRRNRRQQNKKEREAMWKKKITGIILAVALALSTAACGTPADKELSGTAAASGLQSQGESEPENSGDKPEPVRLVVEVYDRGNMPEDYGDPTDNNWVNIIQEKL